MIDKIILYPIVDATGYPDKTDAVQKRIEKHQEEYCNQIKMVKMERKLDELILDLYNKKAEQQKLRLEIFNNRTIDVYA